MSRRDLSPVSENRRPSQHRKSISDEIGPSLEQKLDIDPPDDGNVALRQIQANSRQNSTETSRFSTSDVDGFVLEESESDIVEDLIAVVGTGKHVQGTRAEGDGPPISGEDSADSVTAKVKRQSSLKEYVVTPGLGCDTHVIQARGIQVSQDRGPKVVWIRHQSTEEIMKITNTDVTMVESSNHECNLNRITFQLCRDEVPDDDFLDHVVFKKATTEKTLAIQDLENDNTSTFTVGVDGASGLNEPIKPEEDVRFFRLRYPESKGDGEPVLLELCKHHGKFLAYEGDRLQVLPHSGDDLASAGTKFRFQIVSPTPTTTTTSTTTARQQMTNMDLLS